MKQSIITLILFLTFQTIQSQNHSLDFDGSDDYVGIPHSASLLIGTNPYTVEFWFKAPNANQLGALIAKAQASSPFNQSSIYVNDGTVPIGFPIAGKKITFSFGTFVGGPYRTITTTSDIVDGNFHHVAGVVDPNAETIVLYVDGVLQTVNLLSSGSFPSVPNTEQYTIGQVSGGLFYTGVVDEVRIWNVVRTQTEIQNNMNIELTGTEPGLVAYYSFNQGIAGGNNAGEITLNDNSSNGNNGTLNNFTLNGNTSNWIGTAAPLVLAAVPTLGQWGLFLFGLIVFTVSLVAGYNLKRRGAVS